MDRTLQSKQLSNANCGLEMKTSVTINSLLNNPLFLRILLNKSALKNIVFSIAAIIFIGGIIYSWENLNLSANKLNVLPVVILITFAIPVSIFLNSCETWLTARLANKRFGFLESLRLTIIAIASNSLPIPGATIVRLSSLKKSGASTTTSIMITLTLIAIWAGVSFLFSGIYLLQIISWLGGASLAVGTTLLLGGVIGLHRTNKNWPLIIYSIALKIFLTATIILRMGLCLYAVGIEASIAQLSIFAIGGLLGSASSIVPAGLGLRELASAVLAPISGIAASAAFVATALNRVISLLLSLLIYSVIHFCRQQNEQTY
ncbi:lysylphosphatidylglycerol synthase domain-containing protein [Hyphococcus lacteus]|uniref:Lysylphosphatidylglycerol synthase domain-containing protein n=1 Tax=Hyphococcus lacteus TaxID=3143536 RepID=A0ABV3Z6K0_9PROT